MNCKYASENMKGWTLKELRAAHECALLTISCITEKREAKDCKDLDDLKDCTKIIKNCVLVEAMIEADDAEEVKEHAMHHEMPKPGAMPHP